MIRALHWLVCMFDRPLHTQGKQLIDTGVNPLRIVISNGKFHWLSKILFQPPEVDIDDMAFGKLFDSYMDLRLIWPPIIRPFHPKIGRAHV